MVTKTQLKKIKGLKKKVAKLKKKKELSLVEKFEQRQKAFRQIGKGLTTRKEQTLRRIIESRGASPSAKARARRLLGE